MELHRLAVGALILLTLSAFVHHDIVFAAEAGGNATAILLKPGHCPRLLNVIPSHKGCVSDEDCPADHKCCVFDCGAVCVPPAFTKPGVCPRRNWGSGLCAEYCSNDNDCPNDEKCCHNGCGHECIEPYTVKPGRCALPQGTHMCAEFCYHDGQCPGEQKCCKTTCGHACSEPC
ncbi:WAP four-disulfide core domain protein 3 [Lycodopsis pacificus]